MVAVIACGLIACANGTETSSSKKTQTASAPAVVQPKANEARLPAETVVATWKGGKMTYGELLKEHKGEFRRRRNQFLQDMYTFERQRIEAAVVQKLVKAAATAKNQTEEEFIKAAEGDTSVSDDEVKKFHASDPRIKNQPFDAIAPRIKAYLEQQKKQKAVLAVFEGLKTEAGMKVELPKVELEKVTFDLAGRPTKGKTDAKVTIVEFSDFQCPYCSRAVGEVEKIVKAYPNDVKVVFMHFPLTSIHPQAKPAAIASQCANAQGKFWEYHDAVFANAKELGDDKLEAHATNAGLDIDKFKACLKDPATAAFVDKDMKQGTDAGVQGTPSFFINGEPHQGIPSLDVVKQYVES